MTQELRQTLKAAVGRILPTDDQPGALEVGAADYVIQALTAGPYKNWLPLFVQGLEALDELTAELGWHRFAEAPPALQDEVLRRVGERTAKAPRLFFRQLIQLTLEGFLGDPRHGGNRDGMGWRVVGVPPLDRCLRGRP